MIEHLQQGSGPPATPDHADLLRLVVLRLQGIEHAVPVEDVVEVLRMVAITPLAEAPPWLCGVIDLRGQVIPVVDLRRRLGMPQRAHDLSTPILVVRARGTTVGLVADEVVEVLTVPSVATSAAGAAAASPSAVSSAIRHRDRLLLLLDTGRLYESAAGLPVRAHAHPA
jgi:purine-binding chemotaxis protein CheW